MSPLHPSVEAFERLAAAQLLRQPRVADLHASGDLALNGIVMRPEQIALLRPAAVLITLNRETGGVLFTHRAKHLSKHPGQISFPGGRIEAADAGPQAAALREAEEEIGLPRGAVEIVGFLDEYFTGTGFRVTPVIALHGPFNPAIDPNEVDSIFEVPIAFLMDRSNHREEARVFEGISRKVYAIPYQEHYIWGVTAGIIRLLHDRIHG